MVKFWVLIPAYKVESFIERCILSVLNQSYQAFEVVIVDDGSPDDSGKIADAFSERDTRIHVIHQENKGLMAARQAAREYVFNSSTSGNEYIVNLDADDRLKENALEILSCVIDRYDPDCVVYGVEKVYKDKCIEKWEEKENKPIELTDKEQIFRKIFTCDRYNSLCRKAFRVEVIKKCDFSQYYHIQYGEDLIQSIDMLNQCDSVLFIPDLLYLYTVNEQSMTQTISIDSVNIDFSVQKRVIEFLNKNRYFSDDSSSVLAKYYRELLYSQLEFINRLDPSSIRVIQKYKEIHESDFYNDYLRIYNDIKLPKYKECMLFLFDNEHYQILSELLSIIEGIKRIYRRLKRMVRYVG